MSNMEYFNTIVGLIFADLFESFPVPLDLRAPAYGLRAGLYGDPEHLTEDEGVIVAAAIEWLIEEEFIRSGVEGSDGWAAFQCVLTHKGLQLLSLPSSLEKQESIGSQMATAARKGLMDGLKDLTKTAMVGGAKLGIQIALGKALSQ